MNDKEVLERFQKNIKIMEKLSFIEAVNEGVRNVGMLADRFGVPSTRMKERLIELGYTFNKL